MSRVTLALVLLLVLLGDVAPLTIQAQEATPAAATMGRLLDVMVERSQLPGEEGFILFGRNIAEPGARHTYFNPDEVGTIVIVVESGVVTYEIDGPGGRILRGASNASPSEEPAPAGSPFTLAAGDAVVYPAQRRVEGNEGGEPAVFLFAVILGPVGPPPPDPSDVGEISSTWLGSYDGPWMALPDGPVALTWERTMIGPGEWRPPAAGGMQVIAQDSGPVGDLLVGGDGSAFNLGNEPVTALLFRVSPGTTADATPAPATPVASPAAATPGSGATEVISEVATVSLLAEAMPEHPAVFDAWTGFFAPDESMEFPSYAPAVSIAADVVVDGEWAARSEGRMQLQRDGTTEEIAPGTEVMLGPGDAVVYVENAAAQAVRNPGDTETHTVSFGVFSVAPPEAEYPGVVNKEDWERSGLAAHDVAVTVERLALPAGSSLPVVTDPRAPHFFAVMEGTVEWVLTQPDGQTPVLRFFPGQMIRFRPLDEGEQLQLRNPGNEPLVLLQLTLSPAQAGAATATPGS
jgi:mannose-6-phosphate isomerase-like protein (cupin superfamily)